MIRLFPYSLKQASVVAVLGCAIVGGVAAIDAPRAGNDQTVVVSVNRTNKGDKLLSVAKPAAQLNGLSSATKLDDHAERAAARLRPAVQLDRRPGQSPPLLSPLRGLISNDRPAPGL